MLQSPYTSTFSAAINALLRNVDLAELPHALFALLLLVEQLAFAGGVAAVAFGGDATRKRKLLDKQKKGKKRMRQFGKVDIPQEAFIAALKVDV